MYIVQAYRYFRFGGIVLLWWSHF